MIGALVSQQVPSRSLPDSVQSSNITICCYYEAGTIESKSRCPFQKTGGREASLC